LIITLPAIYFADYLLFFYIIAYFHADAFMLLPIFSHCATPRAAAASFFAAFMLPPLFYAYADATLRCHYSLDAAFIFAVDAAFIFADALRFHFADFAAASFRFHYAPYCRYYAAMPFSLLHARRRHTLPHALMLLTLLLRAAADASRHYYAAIRCAICIMLIFATLFLLTLLLSRQLY